jgi:undecaprenyl-diphosphatase
MTTIEASNQALFLIITRRHRQVDVARLIADYFIYLVPLALIAMWLFGGKCQREVAIRACCVPMVPISRRLKLSGSWS